HTQLSLSHTHTHTHTHTRTQTHTHINTHTHTHTYVCLHNYKPFVTDALCRCSSWSAVSHHINHNSTHTHTHTLLRPHTHTNTHRLSQALHTSFPAGWFERPFELLCHKGFMSCIYRFSLPLSSSLTNTFTHTQALNAYAYNAHLQPF